MNLIYIYLTRILNMCGFSFTILNNVGLSDTYISDKVNNITQKLKHRGPDSQNYKVIEENISNKTIILIHTRLHINGDSSPQPIIDNTGTIYLIINGEIFNWEELSQELNYTCTKSDCEIIIPLYKKYIRKDNLINTFFEKLNGQFSFVLYDSLLKKFFVGRDHIGITPMYYGINDTGITFSSELKTLMEYSTIKTFYPRNYIYEYINESNHRTYSYLNYFNNYNFQSKNESEDIIKQNIRTKLIDSVKLQLNNLDINTFGVLLSGGLDSSLIASIVSRFSDCKIKTFSIGLSKNSCDIIAARKVAEFIGSEHYEFYFSIEEGINAIDNTIYYTESYDTTSVRASTPMYLLTKKIKEKFPNIKIIFSGELSDELFCYLYGSNAPSELDYYNETVNLVSNVHLFDCLRANKTCMANNIEVRVPFTDPAFINYILQIPNKYKIFGVLNKNLYNTIRIEKQLLRDSFDTQNYLPDEILYRRKETFGDGVSNNFNGDNSDNWIESIKDFCNNKYSNVDFDIKKMNYTYNRPNTKEELYYRELFCNFFNKTSFNNTSELTVKIWRPNWCTTIDPSARLYSTEQFET